MTLKEKILFHLVHPAKLATDIAAAVISLYFFWQHQLALGLVLHIAPPIIASAALIGLRDDYDAIKNSRLGDYLVRYMTPAAQATRLLGDIVTVWLRGGTPRSASPRDCSSSAPHGRTDFSP